MGPPKARRHVLSHGVHSGRSSRRRAERLALASCSRRDRERYVEPCALRPGGAHLASAVACIARANTRFGAPSNREVGRRRVVGGTCELTKRLRSVLPVERYRVSNSRRRVHTRGAPGLAQSRGLRGLASQLAPMTATAFSRGGVRRAVSASAPGLYACPFARRREDPIPVGISAPDTLNAERFPLTIEAVSPVTTAWQTIRNVSSSVQ